MRGDETMFGVNFADGRIKGYPVDNKTYYAYYCRGNISYGINNFANNGDATIGNILRFQFDRVTSIIRTGK